jgi:hypothetical protein
LNRKYKKLKQTKRTIKRRKSNILKRPQFSRNPIPRKKRTKRLHYTTPPVDVNSTQNVLIETSSTTVRTFTHTGISELEKTEEATKAEKETAKTQGGPQGR